LTCGRSFAQGAEHGALKLELEGSLEIQTDHVFAADDADEELTNTEQTLDLESVISFGKAISIHSLATFDSVRDPEPGKSRFLKAIGLHLDNLYLELEHHNLKLRAGKYDVAFAVAWDRAFGIYGTDIAEDYEIENKIALGAEFTLDLENWGKHVLSGSAFFSDTSFLSDSLFTSTGRLKKSDGGLANTNSFSSFALNLMGDAGAILDNASYNLAVSLQDGGADAAHDQFAAALALYGSLDLTDDVLLKWLLESAYIANFEGSSTDRFYTTASGKFGYGDLWFAPSVTHWVGVSGRGRDEHAVLTTASFGINLTENLEMAIGYAFFTETGEDKHVLGFKAEFGF
jgi:hypothetical protein